MNSPIIAINAPVGAGKTSLLDFFKRDGYRPLHAPVAESLKSEVCERFPLERGWLDHNKNIARPLLIAWAELRRYQQGDYWISKLVHMLDYAERIDPNPAIGTFFYVDDIRYINELTTLKGLGAVTVHLDCPAQESVNYMVSKGLTEEQAWGAANSQGETELPAHKAMFDIVIAASRHRPLRSIYEDLKYQLQMAGAL